MSTDKTYNDITKENFQTILRTFAKHFRKLNGKTMPAELILVGGAAVMARYGFRDTTRDLDSIIRASSAIREAASMVEDEFGLEHNWLNDDFQRTDSYSKELVYYSKYFRTYYGVLDVRVIDAEYLVAMKLVSGRENSNDLPDIVGIIAEQKEMGEPITFEKVDRAMNDLYYGWERVSEEMKDFLDFVLAYEDLDELYENMKEFKIGTSNEVSLELQKEIGFSKTKDIDLDL